MSTPDTPEKMAMVHPATRRLLQFFAYQHLPEGLQELSRPFHSLAYQLVTMDNTDSPELTVALRRLLEAKDCAVRARLECLAAQPKETP